MNKLDSLELEHLDEEVEEKKQERFKVENLQQANWCFRKLKAINSKKEELKQVAKEEIARIETWLENELKAYDNSEEYFNSLLTNYYIEEREKDDKFRLKTPWGAVSSRKQQPKFNRDNDKLLEWLKENDLKEYIQVEEKAQWGELKKNIKVVSGQVVTEDGEIVAGVTAEERPEKINIKVEE